MSLLNNKFEDLTIHDADADITMGASEEKTQVTPAQRRDVFTFVTVYYKYGEWGTEVFDTLRKGLLEFIDSTAPESEKESLALLDDKDLAERLLEIGTKRIDEQISHGLVGIIKGPRFEQQPSSTSTVFLEVYYKHGEWDLKEDDSSLLDDAMERVERDMDPEEWDALDEDEQMEAALERSSQDVEEQRGWGVVESFPGRIYAMA